MRGSAGAAGTGVAALERATLVFGEATPDSGICLLYTSDAADDLLCVDLGGRRIIKKKKNDYNHLILTRTSPLKYDTIPLQVQ